MVSFLPDHHQETVYNYDRPEPPAIAKPPRYKSRFAGQVRQEYAEGKAAHHTMGEAVGSVQPKPDEYLKKKTREDVFQKRVKSARVHRDKDCGNDRRRPPVPKATDHIATPYRTRRNFVHKNALDAMLSEPPNAAGGKDSSDSSDACYVDSPRGNTQPLKASGMAPNYVEKPKFGKVPGYLKKFKSDKAAEALKWEQEQEEIMRKREMMKLQDSERRELLEGLRANWSHLHHTYQGLSLLTDTLPKKNRREKIEVQLDEIEKFIDLIDKHPVIIISDNPYIH